ncbi:hypothetical protein CDD83_10217 [Cordyceps sp. RAO-2017]|nr:hypothetical protein CDD83_10217 [Cordyceps sp. RAO-2017]
MAQADAFDRSSHHSLFLTTSRPADPDEVLHDEKRASSRHAKLNRRESRLGLKSFFGRSKPPKEPHAVPNTIHAPRSTRIRASFADLGHWPHAHHSDAALASSPSWTNLQATPEMPQHDHLARDAPADRAMSLKMSKQSRPALSNWSTPPLFKAFPQAVKSVTLPAATISADAILRLNEKRHGIPSADDAASSVLAAGDRDKEKRRHRRNTSASAERLEWTTKIFVLVTSGYVLQYAGDGHFDRLPEKMLRLGPSSAAFATDAIPGRHWVVHVSSTAEADGPTAPESRSLFSKLPFRMDRRNTSNLLMVFECPDAMDAWIATLRGEIEKLGGKKNLSETGRPKTMDGSQSLRERRPRRTLMARDVPRPPTSHASLPARARDRGMRGSGGTARALGLDAPPDHAFEDDSTSNSGLSQDERQLDSLRDPSHRISLISSSQRTVVTSAGPSPEASPTREQGAGRADEMATHPGDFVVRPRPNASDIAYRRQSSQVGGPFIDGGLPDQATSRSPSACGTVFRGDGVLSPVGLYPTPNFSVPHSSNRRFSHARVQLAEADASLLADRAGETSPRAARGKAPPAVRANHALSTVLDQPPPRDEAAQRPSTGYRGSRHASPTKTASQARLRSNSRGRERLPAVVMAEGGPVVRTGRSMPPGRQREAYDRPRSPPLTPRDHDDKFKSSFLDTGSPQRGSQGSSYAASVESGRRSDLHHGGLVADPGPGGRPGPGPGRIQPHASTPHLKVDMTQKALLNRRSMPQLLEGPPPAPPPTRALPPIPQNLVAPA